MANHKLSITYTGSASTTEDVHHEEPAHLAVPAVLSDHDYHRPVAMETSVAGALTSIVYICLKTKENV